MKPYIEEKEDRLLALERSYRNQRIGAGFLAAFIGFALLCLFVLDYANQKTISPSPDIHAEIPIPVFWSFALWFFFAYRAQTKLTLIRHIKHLRKKERSEESGSGCYPPAPGSA